MNRARPWVKNNNNKKKSAVRFWWRKNTRLISSDWNGCRFPLLLLLIIISEPLNTQAHKGAATFLSFPLSPSSPSPSFFFFNSYLHNHNTLHSLCRPGSRGWHQPIAASRVLLPTASCRREQKKKPGIISRLRRPAMPGHARACYRTIVLGAWSIIDRLVCVCVKCMGSSRPAVHEEKKSSLALSLPNWLTVNSVTAASDNNAL